MMDRFKFRGMTLCGEWVYGNLAVINKKIKHCGMTIESGFYISNKVGMPFAYPVRPETIGQSTGLKDKNGKLIYEGDIFKAEVINSFDEDEYLYKIIRGQVSWFDIEGCFAFARYQPSDLFEIEIIGNIHQNKELLDE
jgi:uncharacterized phage protein (TIGR01671 family)